MSTTRREALVCLRAGLAVGLISLGLTNPAAARSTNALELPAATTRSRITAQRSGDHVVEPAPSNHEAVIDMVHASQGDDPHSGRQASRRA